ncbi:MAG: hypothetical protein AMXMBFR12_01920 [Candidatus Babeliales bacterium]
MKLMVITFFTISLACIALEHSNSSNSSNTGHSPRSPREELQIEGDVERIQDRDRKGRVIRELYKATLASNAVISVDATFDKKNHASYFGFWRRGQKQPQTMSAECAKTYFEKLKLAYLQNNQSIQS